MFILDFFLGGLMDQFIDWVYSQLVGFFGNFFAEMGNMGVELFEMSWVQSIVLFFSYLAWALYVVGLVVAVFEVGIEYQTGRANVKDAALNAIKGFMAVSCFTLVPVELYKLSVTLQASLTSGITGYGESFDVLSTDIITSLQEVDIGTAAASGVFGGIGSITSPIMVIFIVIMMGYAIIKCFFSNLKRGGILLIQIAVGSLYMFSVPRGYPDLLRRALAIEDAAKPNLTSVRGLGRNWAWRDFIRADENQIVIPGAFSNENLPCSCCMGGETPVADL